LGFRCVYNRNHDLNFGAFGTFSPLNILSAPTFLPLLGHPYFGPNKLLKKPQELAVIEMKTHRRKITIGLVVNIGYVINVLNLQILFQECNSWKLTDGS
jgi:hypothetical protein